MDLQPYFFVVGIILFVNYRRIERNFLSLFIPGVGFFLAAAISNWSDIEIIARSAVIYLTPIVVCHAVFGILRNRGGTKFVQEKKEEIFTKIILSSVWINLIVGFIQLVVSKDFFRWLVELRTSENRGVTGLTPEPSMFGLTLLLTGILIYCLNIPSKKKNFYFFLIIFQVLVFSQSALAIVSMILIIITILIREHLKIFFGVFFVLFSSFLIFSNVDFAADSNIRALELLRTFLSDPSNMLYLDGSISERFYHAFLPIFGYGFPRGLSSFADMVVRGQELYPSYWYGDPTNKIISGVGAVFWEIGLFSIPLFVLPFSLGRKAFGRGRGVVVGVALLLVFVHSINYGMPIYSIICGYLAYVASRNKIGAGRAVKTVLITHS